MENREQQILSEIKSMMSSIRSQLELLDAKMALLQQAVDSKGEPADPIDLDITDDDLPFADDPVSIVEPDPVVEPEPDPVLIADPEPVEEPVLAVDPEPAPVVQTAPVRPTVIDSMTARQAWRTDMPGTQVKDIRSAISLNDRILFINMLFAQDPLKFHDTLSTINQMTDLDQAVAYLYENNPEWDFESDVVYRFMMAVRRRIR